MTRQPHQQHQIYITIPRLWIYADVERSGDIYAIFCRFCYFILFVCETTGYVSIKFLKKKSEALTTFWSLVTLLKQ